MIYAQQQAQIISPDNFLVYVFMQHALRQYLIEKPHQVSIVTEVKWLLHY